MRYAAVIVITLSCWHCRTLAQETPSTTEQQIEDLADKSEVTTEDDSYWQELEQYRKNPIDLNTADPSALRELPMITDLQVESLIAYRRLLGKLVNIYELQAVPAWDVVTIRKVLPFVTLSSPVAVTEDVHMRLKKGEHSLLLRVSQVLERSKGFDKNTTGSKYEGSPQKVFIRYRYAYKDLLQYGLVAEKDAGEQFFRGAEHNGFDFYSFHLVARKLGLIQTLVIGDFTVNMGQGLIHWQSLAFSKSSNVIDIKRQSSALRPYNSAGEFYFHRGAGVTLKYHHCEATVFVSLRRLNANIDLDTSNGRQSVSSFLTSGNNRTETELTDKNSLSQMAFGSTVRFANRLSGKNRAQWHIALNGVYYKFSLPLRPSADPYDLYAINGDRWYNMSIDYSGTFRNLHFFGELAGDKQLHSALINGLLISVDPRVDLSILYRALQPAYRAVYGDAFTENTTPSNENGIYAGISIRPRDAWRLDAYADIYWFPWLRYLVDAPSHGRDFLVQLTYTLNKQTELNIRYRNEVKQVNKTGSPPVTNYPGNEKKQDVRVQVNYRLSRAISFRNRIQSLWFDDESGSSETGFIAFFDILLKPPLKSYSAVMRWQYFETDSYNSRLYAYENDVLYSYSIPVFYGKGEVYYFTMNYDITRKLSVWIRWSQTIYNGQPAIGSGLDEVRGNKRTEIKLQARYIF